MSGLPPRKAVVGCLLDVSDSMRYALEAGRSGEDAIDRLRAVLRAALKLAQAEKRHNPNAVIFVGVFGLKTSREHSCPPAVDLCGIVDVLVSDSGYHHSGHDLLIARANENKVPHVSKYIRTKLSDEEARIVYGHLKLHPEKVTEFVNAIPPEKKARNLHSTSQVAGLGVGLVLSMFIPGATLLVALALLGAGFIVGDKGADIAEDLSVENSEAMKLARRIQKEWLWDFTEFVPRPVSEVVSILQRLQDHEDHLRGTSQRNSNDNQLDSLRRYMYGFTPMCHALELAREAFRSMQDAERRVLVLVSDGNSTDGDPIPAAHELRDEGVSVSTVYLVDNQLVDQRTLYYKEDLDWPSGARTLFQMSGKVACLTHPIPVLASVGWKIPSAGEIALFSMVCSAAALDEFCSLLLSACFGSADALLDIVGRIHLDDYINGEHVSIQRKPSDQGNEGVCYAHATASAVHMALLRIVSPDDGIPTVKEIRERIKEKFLERPEGHSTRKVLEKACTWYRRTALRFQQVDEDGARQAVLRRRPVLATFHLSEPGWDEFSDHFDMDSEMRRSVLKKAQMEPYRSQEDYGGHAVVLIGCNPNSLTFLNSWGSSWGDNGCFSVEDSSALGCHGSEMKFYDVFWLESDLSIDEQEAYNTKVDEELCRRADEHPSIFELEYRCPKCRKNAPLAKFRVNIRRAICPNCEEPFEAEAGHLVQALYLRAGLGDVT